MAWDEAKRAKAIELYEAGEPTPENSMEIVKEVAEKLGETPNGVRMVLSKAEVYVKKEPATAKAKATGEKKEGTSTRVSKEDALASLQEAIEAAGAEFDADICGKLTGKAMQYFTGVLNAASKE